MAALVLATVGCATESDEGVGTTRAGEDPTTTPPTPSTTGDGGAITSTTGAGDGGSGHSWQRVDLGFVSAYILHRDGEAAVIDTGVAGSAASIESGLTAAGLGWDSVGHVILTHKHPDHQGSIGDVLTAAPGAAWYAGAEDIGTISAEGGVVVEDGASVFDLDIIATPGHTPGHVSVLDALSGVLVAGDALNGTDGGVTGANPQFSDDMNAANASVAKLAAFDYEVALFGHGEPVLNGASASVAQLASEL